MKKRDLFDRERILALVKGFVKAEAAHIWGTTETSAKVTAHYLTMANSLTSKISNCNNTMFILMSSDGTTTISIMIGKRQLNHINVTIKNNTLCYS